jgi:hypothetical protein
MADGRELLTEAVWAHGGIERWRAVRHMVIHARSGGIALPLRLKPAAFKSYEANITAHKPGTVIAPYPAPGYEGVFEEGRVSIFGPEGRLIATREDPRAYFGGFRRKIFWDALDTLYFGGYALWNYLNLPFLLFNPAFVVNEMEPWDEDGERLRRLHAVFPDNLPTHCKEQIFYFNSKGLLVRHDYTAEVFGRWARAAHYSGEHREFGGIVIPTRRRVYPRGRLNHPRRLITLVSIDIEDVKIIREGAP